MRTFLNRIESLRRLYDVLLEFWDSFAVKWVLGPFFMSQGHVIKQEIISHTIHVVFQTQALIVRACASSRPLSAAISWLWPSERASYWNFICSIWLFNIFSASSALSTSCCGSAVGGFWLFCVGGATLKNSLFYALIFVLTFVAPQPADYFVPLFSLAETDSVVVTRASGLLDSDRLHFPRD